MDKTILSELSTEQEKSNQRGGGAAMKNIRKGYNKQRYIQKFVISLLAIALLTSGISWQSITADAAETSWNFNYTGGKDSDNSIATDNYLFERTMQKALMGETGGVELSKRNGVGQALYADAIVKKAEVGITYIFDAKFYDSNIVTDKKGLAYKAQHNRFQICSYLEQYCASEKVPQNAVRGILVHAVDDEKYEKWKVLENGRIDVGRYTIGIKFIHIDRSADAIINQFRSLIS